ncbi:MAG: geranylgeranylglyceryl/heptaprenylglyceryl phosphate synthase [Brumimicrobium sp.]|nr:geranylgeranylglyceryl/heptaprenylglyceryl phosphate synthase [Brumimicrobium sp.]
MASCQGQVAVLIDPEKTEDLTSLATLIDKAHFAGIDYFFVGGSTVTRTQFRRTMDYLSSNTPVPVVIFPGDNQQISEEADAILYLSLLSGRNPDYLIGQHVSSAQEVFDLDLEVIPTAYLLVDGGTKSSVAYVSQTTPIPRDQTKIALNTSLAGILQGKKVVYFDAGSGARWPVPEGFIKGLRTKTDSVIIVGGGIRDSDTIRELAAAGANIIVVGNGIEENLDFLLDIKNFKEQYSK